MASTSKDEVCGKQKHDSTFDEDAIDFCLANFVSQFLGKPVSGYYILLCQGWRKSCVTIGSTIDTIVKRGDCLKDVPFQWLPRGSKPSVSRLFNDHDSSYSSDEEIDRTIQIIHQEYEDIQDIRLKLAQLQAGCEISAEGSAEVDRLLLNRSVSA